MSEPCTTCGPVEFSAAELESGRVRRDAVRARQEGHAPTASIVIPSLNGHVRNQLAQTLESLGATGEADEIIVGDDYHEWNTDQPGEARDDFPLKAFETPEDRVLVNLVAVYRLLWDDDSWADWRTFLAGGFDFDGGCGVIRMQIPEALLAEVETPEMLEYGRMIRSTYPSGAAQTNA